MTPLREFVLGIASQPRRYRFARAFAICTSLALVVLVAPLLSCDSFVRSETEPPQLPEARTWQEILKKANPDLGPMWTSDGKHLIFTYTRGQHNDGSIYLVDSSGTTLTRLSEGDREFHVDYSPNISPDDSRVVYTTTRHPVVGNLYRTGIRRNFDIETLALDGSEHRVRLTFNGDQDYTPRWSPSGHRIAFRRNPYRGGVIIGLYTMAHNGTDLRLLVPRRENAEIDLNGVRARFSDDNFISDPIWSPDGKYLAFTRIESVVPLEATEGNEASNRSFSRSAVFSIGEDGTGLIRLFTAAGSRHYPDGSGGLEEQQQVVGFPAWSPDGQRIAFLVCQSSRELKGKLELMIYTVRPDGSELRQVAALTTRAGPLHGLSWSPVDSRVLFAVSGSRGSNENVYVADLDNGDVKIIANGSYASWSPDGSKVAVIAKSSNDYLYVVDMKEEAGLQVLVSVNKNMELKAANR